MGFMWADVTAERFRLTKIRPRTQAKAQGAACSSGSPSGGAASPLREFISRRSRATWASVERHWGRNWPISSKRSEEHTSELQSLMRISYAVFCLKKKKLKKSIDNHSTIQTLQLRTHHPDKNCQQNISTSILRRTHKL